MHQTVSERKREILMRSAQSRLEVLESLDAAREGVGHTWSRMMVPRKWGRISAVAGGGLLGVWLLRRLMHRRPAPAPVVAAAPAGGSPMKYVLAQMFTLLVLPWLRSRSVGTDWGDTWKRYQPSSLFFRWLGLEK